MTCHTYTSIFDRVLCIYSLTYLFMHGSVCLYACMHMCVNMYVGICLWAHVSCFISIFPEKHLNDWLQVILIFSHAQKFPRLILSPNYWTKFLAPNISERIFHSVYEIFTCVPDFSIIQFVSEYNDGGPSIRAIIRHVVPLSARASKPLSRP